MKCENNLNHLPYYCYMVSGYFRSAFIWVIVVGFISINAMAQPSVFYEVSGPNIKTSYIFGHVPSNEAQSYNVLDSVYMVLDRCSALAVEDFTDSIAAAQFKMALKLPEGTDLDVLTNPDQFDRVEQLFRQYASGDFREYNTHSPLLIMEAISEGYSKSVTGPVFHDFLINVSKEERKKMISVYKPIKLAEIYKGVPVDIQLSILLNYVQKINRQKRLIERMSRLYTAVNIKALKNVMIKGAHYEHYYNLIKGRVALMGQVFPQLSRKESVFYLLHAGLLPGEEGLLELLKSKGYKIRAIGSGFSFVLNPNGIPEKIEIPDSLKVHEGKMLTYFDLNSNYNETYFRQKIPTWENYTSYRGAFSIRMPVKPEIIIDQIESEEIPVSVFAYKFEDRAMNLFYLVSYYDYPETYNPAYQENFFNDLIANTVNKFGGLLLLEKDISEGRLQGREIHIRANEENVIRIQFYLSGQRLYQVALGSVGQKAFSEQNNAYMRSFRILNEKSGYWFTVQLGDFDIWMPEEPDRRYQVLNDGVIPADQYLYQVSEPNTQMDFLAGITYMPKDGKIKKLKSVFNRMINKAAENLDGVLIKEEIIKEDKIKGRYFEIGSSTDTVARIYLYYYKQRFVQIMVSGPDDSAYSGYADRFFKSFKWNELR